MTVRDIANVESKNLAGTKRRPRSGRSRWLSWNWPSAVLIIVLLALWQLVAPHVSNLLIVPPTKVAERARDFYHQGILMTDIRVSTEEFLLGFALAAVAGIIIGFIVGAIRTLDRAVQPLMSGLYSIPIIAFGPIFIIEFGLGLESKVVVVALSAIFPIVINITSGVKETPDEYLDMARSLSLSRVDVIRKVVVPSTLPYIMVGLRLGAARGLVGVLGGELFGATDGVGYRLLTSAESFDTAGIYVGIVYFLIFGILISGLFHWLNRQLTPWRSDDGHA